MKWFRSVAAYYLPFLLPGRIARGIELYEARNAAIGYDARAVMEALDADKVYLGELLCLSPKHRQAVRYCREFQYSDVTFHIKELEAN